MTPITLCVHCVGNNYSCIAINESTKNVHAARSSNRSTQRDNGQRDNGYTLRVFNLVWEWQIPESQPQGSGNKDDISIYFETTWHTSFCQQ